MGITAVTGDNNPPVGVLDSSPAVIDTRTKIAPSGTQPSYTPAEKTNDRNIWTDFMVNSTYEKDRHIYLMGLTSPGGFNGATCAAVKLCTSTEVLVCIWTGCQWSDVPLCPDPESLDSNWVLLDDWWEPAVLVTAPDGTTPLYRLSGVFIYGCLNPSILTWQDVEFPLAPWLDPSKFPVRFVGQNDLLKTIIKSSPSNKPLQGIPVQVQ